MQMPNKHCNPFYSSYKGEIKITTNLGNVTVHKFVEIMHSSLGVAFRDANWNWYGVHTRPAILNLEPTEYPINAEVHYYNE